MQDGTSGDFPAISPNCHVANANVVNKRDPTQGKPRIDQIPDLTATPPHRPADHSELLVGWSDENRLRMNLGFLWLGRGNIQSLTEKLVRGRNRNLGFARV